MKALADIEVRADPFSAPSNLRFVSHSLQGPQSIFSHHQIWLIVSARKRILCQSRRTPQRRHGLDDGLDGLSRLRLSSVPHHPQPPPFGSARLAISRGRVCSSWRSAMFWATPVWPLRRPARRQPNSSPEASPQCARAPHPPLCGPRPSPVCIRSSARRGRSTGSGCHDHRALNEVLQFANIPRPIMVLDRFHYVLGDAVDGFALPLGELSNEMVHQQGDIAVVVPAAEAG